jgi:hypothetical protein
MNCADNLQQHLFYCDGLNFKVEDYTQAQLRHHQHCSMHTILLHPQDSKSFYCTLALLQRHLLPLVVDWHPMLSALQDLALSGTQQHVVRTTDGFMPLTNPQQFAS